LTNIDGRVLAKIKQENLVARVRTKPKRLACRLNSSFSTEKTNYGIAFPDEGRLTRKRVDRNG
jgi:hypothetical protein